MKNEKHLFRLSYVWQIMADIGREIGVSWGDGGKGGT